MASSGSGVEQYPANPGHEISSSLPLECLNELAWSVDGILEWKTLLLVSQRDDAVRLVLIVVWILFGWFYTQGAQCEKVGGARRMPVVHCHVIYT